MLEPWIFGVMVAWQPPRDTADVSRYQDIAHDLAAVAEDPQLAPLVTGEHARPRTALLMLAVAYFESTFARGIDEGRIRGDHGRSWCMMQIKIGKGRTQEGWSGRDLVADRRKCFRVGHRMLRESLATCASVPEDARLGAYVRGRCLKRDRVSELRVMLARAYWEKHAVSFNL
jgi:hypothetical protein